MVCGCLCGVWFGYLLLVCRLTVWYGLVLGCYAVMFVVFFAFGCIGIVNSVVDVAMYLCAPVPRFGLYAVFVGFVWCLLFSCLCFAGFGWLFSDLGCKVARSGCAIGLLIAWFGLFVWVIAFKLLRVLGAFC